MKIYDVLLTNTRVYPVHSYWIVLVIAAMIAVIGSAVL